MLLLRIRAGTGAPESGLFFCIVVAGGSGPRVAAESCEPEHAAFRGEMRGTDVYIRSVRYGTGGAACDIPGRFC